MVALCGSPVASLHVHVVHVKVTTTGVAGAGYLIKELPESYHSQANTSCTLLVDTNFNSDWCVDWCVSLDSLHKRLLPHPAM